MKTTSHSKTPLFLAILLFVLTAPIAWGLTANGQDEPPAEADPVAEPAAEPADPAPADPEPADPAAEPPAEDPAPANEPAPAENAEPADPVPADPEKVDADVPLPNPDDPTEDAPKPEPMPVEQLTNELAQQAAAAKEAFRPITPEQVNAARESAQQAATTLEKMFQKGDDQYEQSWKDFLHWNDLQSGLTAETPDYPTLTQAYERFRINMEGNQLKNFTDTRDSLERFLNLSFGASQANLNTNYGQILDRLATLLQQQSAEATTDRAEEIGRLLGWLNRYEQAPELAQAVSATYSQPNVFAEVSAAFVSTGLEQDINRETNIAECILGTRIWGKGFTIGSTAVELIPSDSQAKMNMVLMGTTNSKNVGVNGPVTIYSTAQTNFNARLPLSFQRDGLTAGTATASANSQSQITGIGAKMKLVRKIATKRVYASKGQAEAIGSNKAAQRVATELNSESGGLVRDANQNYSQKFRKPLVIRGAFPQQLDFRTDAERVYVVSRKDGADQLAAYGQPPALNGSYDMAVRFHESAVGNYAEDMIGGETLTDEKLVKMIEDSGREVPEELKITPETDPWSITFASEQPITVRFADNTVRIAVRGRRFTRQDQAITKAAAISALYQVERTGNGAKLVRQGEVEVDYISRGRQTLAETAFKAFLKNKFEAMFKPEFEFSGLQLPGRFADVGTMQLEQLDINGSWAAIGWVMPANVEAE